MIIGINTVTLYYQYFYSKKYSSPRYKFKPTSQAITKIHAFIKSIDKLYDLNTIGHTFLTNYFLFQLSRTHGQTFNRFASKHTDGSTKVGGKIQVYDIIGKKALDYWVHRDQRFDYTIQSNSFIREHNVSLGDLRSLFYIQEPPPVKLQSEEVERGRFFNSDRGLLNCLEQTTLYDNHSYLCLRCQSKVSCKELLRVNYEQIYNSRYGALSH